MASQLYVPGPTFVFTGTGNFGAYEFLAYTEDAVELNFEGSFMDVRADFGGPNIPVDVQYMGEQAFVSFRALRYDEAVMQHCMARLAGGTAGQVLSNTLGSLMISQSFAYKLFLYCPYNTNSFFGTMVKGFVFGAAYLHGNTRIPLGVIVKKPECTFRAIPVWTPWTLSSVLYSNTLPYPLPSPD